jgi:hypothetical protein
VSSWPRPRPEAAEGPHAVGADGLTPLTWKTSVRPRAPRPRPHPTTHPRVSSYPGELRRGLLPARAEPERMPAPNQQPRPRAVPRITASLRAATPSATRCDENRGSRDYRYVPFQHTRNRPFDRRRPTPRSSRERFCPTVSLDVLDCSPSASKPRTRVSPSTSAPNSSSGDRTRGRACVHRCRSMHLHVGETAPRAKSRSQPQAALSPLRVIARNVCSCCGADPCRSAWLRVLPGQ